MLQTSTIEPRTLSLLRTLMELPYLKDFHLVGGTALALKYGHRVSVDLDLFGGNGYDKDFIIESLKLSFGLNAYPYFDKRSILSSFFLAPRLVVFT